MAARATPHNSSRRRLFNDAYSGRIEAGHGLVSRANTVFPKLCRLILPGFLTRLAYQSAHGTPVAASVVRAANIDAQQASARTTKGKRAQHGHNLEGPYHLCRGQHLLQHQGRRHASHKRRFTWNQHPWNMMVRFRVLKSQSLTKRHLQQQHKGWSIAMRTKTSAGFEKR